VNTDKIWLKTLKKLFKVNDYRDIVWCVYVVIVTCVYTSPNPDYNAFLDLALK
jgi:hypothetical protein